MNEIPTNNPEFFPDGLMENVVTEATTSTECVNNNKRNGKIEAPDKIYVPQHNIEAGSIQELDEFIVKGSIEYIRKDALLEHLKQGQSVSGLEEEVKKYWNAHALDYRVGRVADLDFIFLCARHFAEWGRKQVLQEIYDGKVKPVDKITTAWLDGEQNT